MLSQRMDEPLRTKLVELARENPRIESFHGRWREECGDLVSEPARCAAQDPGVAEGVERGASAQQSGIPDCRKSLLLLRPHLLQRGVRQGDSNGILCPHAPYPGSNRTGSN